MRTYKFKNFIARRFVNLMYNVILFFFYTRWILNNIWLKAIRLGLYVIDFENKIYFL